MIFSSAAFFFFFIIVIALHWYLIPGLIPERYRLRVLHIFLLVASYIFYMSWQWQFGFLIAFSTLVDYFAGLYMGGLDRRAPAPESSDADDESDEALRLKARLDRLRRLALFVSILTNLGILFYFKYTDFFIGSFVDLVNSVAPGTYGEGERDTLFLKLILPLGISFFTFQSMSYTIDVYRRVIPTEYNFIRFALYVSFFPQLVAGPIVVARDFLPQLQKLPEFNLERMRVAARWFALGYFKKVVLADNMAPIVDAIYKTPEAYDTLGHWIGGLGFWVQVYGDFSGYSDMAWGTAIFMGFHLPENFRIPYLSRSITEHWQRWHISLIKWIRDYLYIPLGGNRTGYLRHKFNVFITMWLAGIWHGANWTFFIWGAIHGSILSLEAAWRELKGKRKAAYVEKHQSEPPRPGRLRALLTALITFCATSFCTIYFGTLFRAQNIQDGWLIFRRMLGFADPALTSPGIPIIPITVSIYRPVVLACLALMAGHLLGHYIFEKKKEIRMPAWAELALTPVVIMLMVQLGASNVAAFIYFVF